MRSACYLHRPHAPLRAKSSRMQSPSDPGTIGSHPSSSLDWVLILEDDVTPFATAEPRTVREYSREWSRVWHLLQSEIKRLSRCG